MSYEYLDIGFIDILPCAKSSMSFVTVMLNLLYFMPTTHNFVYLLTSIIVHFFHNYGEHSIIKQLVEEYFRPGISVSCGLLGGKSLVILCQPFSTSSSISASPLQFTI